MAKAIISISVDPQLLKRIDAVAEAREATRSSVIERMLRDEIESEEGFLEMLESPLFRGMSWMMSNEKVLRAMGAAIGEHMSPEEGKKLKDEIDNQISLGAERQRSKRSKPKRSPVAMESE